MCFGTVLRIFVCGYLRCMCQRSRSMTRLLANRCMPCRTELPWVCFSTRMDDLALPDFVNAGLAFVDDVQESGGSLAFSLSIDEPWSWQVGLQVAIKIGCLPQLVAKVTHSLDWETTTASVRGTTVELLLAVLLRATPDIGKRVTELVRDAQRSARVRSLPKW